MSVRLLLLLALVGPFCAFTHASPTELPEEIPPYSEGYELNDAYSTDTDQPVLPAEEVAATTEGLSTPPASLPATTEPAATPTQAETDAPTDAAETTPEVTTVLPTETNTPDVPTAAADVLTSEPVTPATETEGATALLETVQTAVVKGAEAEVGEEVVVEGEAAEGLGSGQVAGIVIGALLAVVVVIAVVIVVLRRMGKYSP